MGECEDDGGGDWEVGWIDLPGGGDGWDTIVADEEGEEAMSS